MQPATGRAGRAGRADRAARTGRPAARWLRWTLLLVVLAVFAAIAVRDGGRARDALAALSPVTLLLALAAAIGAVCCSMLAWRALLADLGSPLRLRPTARIFFVGQLAKYVPGSVFVVVAQMELGRDLGVPRQRSGTASLLLIPVSVCSAVSVALLAVPFATPDALGRYWPVVLLVPLSLAVLHPKVLRPTLGRLLLLARRQPLERLPSPGGTVRAVAWSAGGFLLLGVHVWLLARDLGAEDGWRLFLLATGAMAAAWTAGFLVVISPGGAGIRELALVGLLAPVLNGGTAVTLALVSRAVMVGADGLVAGLAAYAGRRRAGTSPPDRDAGEPRPDGSAGSAGRAAG